MGKFKKTKCNYSKLGRITFIRGLWITVGAVAAVFALRMLTRGHLADAIVGWFARSLSISEMEADLLYFKLVTVNMQFILALVIIIFVFLLFHMLLDTYKRYFDEVVTGIDMLMEERAAISLSPELESVEHKLADVKRTLAERADKAKRAEQQKNDLVVYLAHDLKTPLTVVRGNVDLLLEGELSGEQRACAADVAEGARQMGTYVSALIDASLGAGASFAPREARLRPLLERLRAQVEALAAASGVRVVWSEGADLPETMLLDEALVERAVANVAANAVEHAPAGSSVAVDVRADVAAGCLALSVADEGPGFSPEALSRGCERFYQGDAARAARGHNGLGLHVAAEAAARHGGSVELANRSAAEGGGARATLRLPLGHAAPQEPVGPTGYAE